MNNPHIKQFLNNIEAAVTGKTDLALRSVRPLLCPDLDRIRALLESHAPQDQRFNLSAVDTGNDTMCIARNMIFTFTFDDVPEFTSRNDQPLVSTGLDEDEKVDLHGIAFDFERSGGTWPAYLKYTRETIEEEELDEDLFELPNTVVGDSDVDSENVRMCRSLGEERRGDNDDFILHMNLNAHFFKRLIEMGIPGRQVGYGRMHKGDYFRGGLVSARAITIDMFVDCSETFRHGRGLGAEYFPRVGVSNLPVREGIPYSGQAGFRNKGYNITRSGFLCKDVRGEPFVLVGVKDTGSAEIINYSIESKVTLAIPFRNVSRPNKRKRSAFL